MRYAPQSNTQNGVLRPPLARGSRPSQFCYFSFTSKKYISEITKTDRVIGKCSTTEPEHRGLIEIWVRKLLITGKIQVEGKIREKLFCEKQHDDRAPYAFML